ncbi:MAG: PadR family transcriptional regulator [Actinomycetota bacterium]|nr:PadR family transcriptional regulator [Actinomycetota bacterium]
MSIPHALLALLAEEPKFGLRLKEEFEARTGAVWPLNVGQVYTTLGRLERNGLVSFSADRGTSASQKLYRLTDDGRVELSTWLTTPPTESSPPRNEVVIKVMVALSVPGVDVEAIVQAHRTQAVEAMQAVTRLKRDAEDLALLLVLDAELLRLEAIVRWLDTCDARLRHGGHLDVPAAEPTADDGTDLTDDTADQQREHSR